MAVPPARAAEAARGARLPPAVVVFGGAGFVGRSVVRQLRAALAEPRVPGKAEPWACGRPLVVSADLRPNPEADATVSINLRDPGTVEEGVFRAFDVQAAVVAVKPPLVGPSYQDFMELNVAGIVDLVRLAEKHHVRQLVYVSSIATCDHWVPHRDCSESDPGASPPLSTLRSPYDLSKAVAEDFVLSKHRPDGMHTVAVRIGGVYGGPDDPYPNWRAPFGIAFDLWYHPDYPKVDLNYVENIAGALVRTLQVLRSDASVGGRFYFYTHGDIRDQQIIGPIVARARGRFFIGAPMFPVRELLQLLSMLDTLLLMLPGLPRLSNVRHGGRSLPPKSHFTARSILDAGFIHQSFDNSLFRATFGYAYLYTAEEAASHMALQAEAEAAAPPAAAPPGAAAVAAAAVLPMCLCVAAALLVVRLCEEGAGSSELAPLPLDTEAVVGRSCLGGTIRDTVGMAHACIMISPPATHILGYATKPSYKLWQPFRGGGLHVFLQGLGWTLFSLLMVQWMMTFNQTPTVSPNSGASVWHLMLGMDDRMKALSGLLSQILLVMSQFVFKGAAREKYD